MNQSVIFCKIRELQRGRVYAYEKHKYEEMGKTSLELHPRGALLSVGAHHWLVLKNFRHSFRFGEKNQFVDWKDQGNSAICFAYASASALEALWRLNLGVSTVVEVTELTNCHPNVQDDGGGGFTEDCLCHVIAYGVDTVPIEDGSLETDEHSRRSVDGYMKVSQFHLEYLILAVAQPVIASMMKVGEF
ncbi:hypothetical protein Vadar_022709 [Vaccinium darrowii]|uniref:Uncharacterized protein n=1 Tax=Vaccinium darrowii TaxID=229202 RepID=A0ACB7YFE4_9ERIC|nr:hypothetical protein Vadar_022709 [Vaccinium darrowii]